jgi:AraC family ethanolamine operon transcriptional activator
VGVQLPPHKLHALGLHMARGVSALHLPGQLPPQALQQLVELSSVLGPNRQHDLDAALVDQAHEQLQHILWSELARRWRQPSSRSGLSLQTRERLLQSVDQWAKDHSTTPLRIDALSEALDVPIWQLERAFLQTYGMTPQRLITLRRLAKARRALQLQTGSVTEVAMGHGFWHLGRFAGLYKSYYGESPSETVRAMG